MGYRSFHGRDSNRMASSHSARSGKRIDRARVARRHATSHHRSAGENGHGRDDRDWIRESDAKKGMSLSSRYTPIVAP
jgi:hypothetical protein